MKPKKGESNAEMDEPIKSPLQLVKEFVLLIVEARTPDLSVKGRIEGPHCPAVRGRQVHKCSKDKVECARASEVCSLAQRLWLNGIPVCLDTLLFPDCERGREEAALTEGAVTKLSAETALLLERWTIDGSRRRQDDCLSSPMVIQALRSYLHFSQISSWLYSMGGKLPGVIAYRIYAPGEVTGLDFIQLPDHHCFPACSINYQHIRVRVSSLQRQASVPKLVCHCERGHGAFSAGVTEKEGKARKHSSKAAKGSRLDTRVESLPGRSFLEQEVATEGSRSYIMAESSGEGCYASLKQLNDSRHSMTCLPLERVENPVRRHSRPFFAAPPSLSMCVTGTDSYSGSLEQTHHGQMLLSESEVAAKKAQELNKMNMFDDDCCLSVEEPGSVCHIRASTGLPLASSLGTKSQVPGLVADEMTSLYCLSDLSLEDIATNRDSYVGQGDYKVQDWRLNSFSDTRREPAGMTERHLVDGGCDNTKRAGHRPSGICTVQATEDDRFKFSEMKSIAVPMKRRRPTSESKKSHHPAIAKEWSQNLSTLHLKEDSSDLVNKKLPVSVMGNCNSSLFEEKVLFQLADRVSCSPYFLEDSDDTPVASPSQTPKANIAAEYFAQIQPEYVKSKFNPHCPQNNFSKVLSDDTQNSSSLLQHVKSSSLSHPWQQPETKPTLFVQFLQPGNIDLQSGMSDKGRGTKEPLENENDVSDPDLSQSTSRRIFQEKSLPLVSYDADSDSFKKVEDTYKSKLLHSPKVLFSCDLPAAQTSCYKKCIDFDDSFEAELFNSKMGDMVNPDFIGRYMSNLATLSRSPIDSLNDVTTDDTSEDLFSNHTQSGVSSQQNNMGLWQKSSTECSNYSKTEENDFGDMKKLKSFNSVVKDTFCADLQDCLLNPCDLKPARRQLYEQGVKHVQDPCTQHEQNSMTCESVFEKPVNKLCKLGEGVHNKVQISRHLEPDQKEENVPLWVKGLQPKCSSAVGPRTSVSLTRIPIPVTSTTINMLPSLSQDILKVGESALACSAAVKSPLEMGVNCSQDIVVSDVTVPFSANTHSSLSESLPKQNDVKNTNCDINCSNCFSNIPVPHPSVKSVNLYGLPSATPAPEAILPNLCNQVIISPYWLRPADQASPKSPTPYNVTSISSNSQPLVDQPSKTFPAAITPICDTSLNNICTQTVHDLAITGHLPEAAQCTPPAPDTHFVDHICQHAAEVALVIPANSCDNQSSLSDGQNGQSHLNAGLTCGSNSMSYEHTASPQHIILNVPVSEGERSACHVYCNGNCSQFVPDLPIFNKENSQKLIAQTVASTTQGSATTESSDLVDRVRNKNQQNYYSHNETKLVSSKKRKISAKESDRNSCDTDLVTTAVRSVDPKVQCDRCLVDQQSSVSSEVSGFSPSNDCVLAGNHPESNHNVIFYLSESEPSAELDTRSSALTELLTLTDSAELVNKPSASRPARLPLVSLDSQSSPDLTGQLGLTYAHKKPSLTPEARLMALDQEMPCCDQRSSPPMSGFQQQHSDHPVLIGLKRATTKSSPSIFNSRTGLPTQSSPAPLKRKSGGKFDYDVNLLSARAIKSAFSCSKLASSVSDDNDASVEEDRKTLSTSAPASTNCLLGNFEESVLNGRIDPVGAVDGFTAEIGASGTFCPKHIHLPVTAFFFALSDDNAPSPYLGHISLDSAGRKGYHIPKKGTVQVTLFNPNKTVVKMFVVVYDFTDMPASSQTFIRQRTVYSPTDKNVSAPSYLRYLIHLRCASSHSGKIYLHTDIRLIFARNKLDIDAKTIPYELKSFTEFPQNPKYSPKK